MRTQKIGTESGTDANGSAILAYPKRCDPVSKNERFMRKHVNNKPIVTFSGTDPLGSVTV